MSAERWRPDLVVACSLDAAALAARREGLLGALVQRAVERAEVADGVRLRFDAAPDILGAIAEVVAAERLCCRFMRFAIDVQPDEGPIALELTGPPGTREFLDAVLPSKGATI